MPAEMSEITINLQKQGDAIVHSGKTHAPQVGATLVARWEKQQETSLSGADESPPKPDFEGFINGVVGFVEHDLEELVEVDESHVGELSDDREKREARDRTTGETRELLSHVQGAVTHVHGKEVSEKLFGHATKLPNDPTKVNRLGRRVVKNLRSGEIDLSEVRLPGWGPPNQEKLADELQRRVNRQGMALAGVGLDGASSDATLDAKHQAIEGYQRTIRQSAVCLGGLYRLAGFDALAEKILPRRRAPRRPGEPDGDDGSATPAEAGTPDAESDSEAGEPTGPIGIVS